MMAGQHVRRGTSHRVARGETQQQARARKRLTRRRNRRELVDYVRERDGDCCRLCGRAVQYTVEAALNHGEVHEYIYRSRGGSDVEPTNCVLVCKSCHTGEEPCIHAGIGHRSKRVIVPLDDDRLMEGPITHRIEHFDEPEPDDEHAIARAA
jgi:5-methylcytosine-specific restriction endonuclease McrA